jgi:signal peptidase II
VSRIRILALVGLPVLVADFITKRLAVTYLQPPHSPHPVLGDAVRFTLAHNQRGVMGLPVGPYGRWWLIAANLVILGVLARLLRATESRHRVRGVALALVMGGAVGNLVDRMASSRGVVDFIDVGTTAWRYWTFNVADIAIDVGLVLLAGSFLRAARHSSPANQDRGVIG